jgi:hypothetical protein
LLGEVFQWHWEDRPRARSLYNQLREEFQFNLESTPKAEPNTPDAAPQIVIEEGAANATPSTRRKRSQKLLEESEPYMGGL